MQRLFSDVNDELARSWIRGGPLIVCVSPLKVSMLGESQPVRRLHFVIHTRSLILLPLYPPPLQPVLFIRRFSGTQ